MDGRSRMDRYQDLRKEVADSNEGSSIPTNGTRRDNSYNLRHSRSAYSSGNRVSDDTGSLDTRVTRNLTTDYDEMLREQEEFLKSLEEQFDVFRNTGSFSTVRDENAEEVQNFDDAIPSDVLTPSEVLPEETVAPEAETETAEPEAEEQLETEVTEFEPVEEPQEEAVIETAEPEEQPAEIEEPAEVIEEVTEEPAVETQEEAETAEEPTEEPAEIQEPAEEPEIEHEEAEEVYEEPQEEPAEEVEEPAEFTEPEETYEEPVEESYQEEAIQEIEIETIEPEEEIQETEPEEAPIEEITLDLEPSEETYEEEPVTSEEDFDNKFGLSSEQEDFEEIPEELRIDDEVIDNTYMSLDMPWVNRNTNEPFEFFAEKKEEEVKEEPVHTQRIPRVSSVFGPMDGIKNTGYDDPTYDLNSYSTFNPVKQEEESVQEEPINEVPAEEEAESDQEMEVVRDEYSDIVPQIPDSYAPMEYVEDPFVPAVEETVQDFEEPKVRFVEETIGDEELADYENYVKEEKPAEMLELNIEAPEEEEKVIEEVPLADTVDYSEAEISPILEDYALEFMKMNDVDIPEKSEFTESFRDVIGSLAADPEEISAEPEEEVSEETEAVQPDIEDLISQESIDDELYREIIEEASADFEEDTFFNRKPEEPVSIEEPQLDLDLRQDPQIETEEMAEELTEEADEPANNIDESESEDSEELRESTVQQEQLEIVDDTSDEVIQHEEGQEIMDNDQVNFEEKNGEQPETEISFDDMYVEATDVPVDEYYTEAEQMLADAADEIISDLAVDELIEEAAEPVIEEIEPEAEPQPTFELPDIQIGQVDLDLQKNDAGFAVNDIELVTVPSFEQPAEEPAEEEKPLVFSIEEPSIDLVKPEVKDSLTAFGFYEPLVTVDFDAINGVNVEPEEVQVEPVELPQEEAKIDIPEINIDTVEELNAEEPAVEEVEVPVVDFQPVFEDNQEPVEAEETVTEEPEAEYTEPEEVCEEPQTEEIHEEICEEPAEAEEPQQEEVQEEICEETVESEEPAEEPQEETCEEPQPEEVCEEPQEAEEPVFECIPEVEETVIETFEEPAEEQPAEEFAEVSEPEEVCEEPTEEPQEEVCEEPQAEEICEEPQAEEIPEEAVECDAFDEPAEEPVTEEPVAEEPVTEEPVAEEVPEEVAEIEVPEEEPEEKPFEFNFDFTEPETEPEEKKELDLPFENETARKYQYGDLGLNVRPFNIERTTPEPVETKTADVPDYDFSIDDELNDMEDLFTSEPLEDSYNDVEKILRDVKAYNIEHGIRNAEDTQVNIISQLKKEEKEKAEEAAAAETVKPAKGGLFAGFFNVNENDEEGFEADNPAEQPKEEEPVFEFTDIEEPEAEAEPVIETEEPVKEPESVEEVNESISNTLANMTFNEEYSLDDDDSYYELDSTPVTTEKEPEYQPQPQKQESEAYIQNKEHLNELTQKIEMERELRQEMFEQTQQLKLQVSEYENELNDVNNNMSRTNRILNVVLTLLIIALFVIIVVIGFFFAQERGLI